MDDKIKTLCYTMADLSALVITSNGDQEVTTDSNNRIIKKQYAANNFYPLSQELQNHNTKLTGRQIKPRINKENKSTKKENAESLLLFIKKQIVFYYLMKGIKINKLLNALDNSFDPLYGNDTELFLKMLTSNEEQKSKTYFEKLCGIDQMPDFNNLFDKLMQMNLDYGYVLDLIDDIKIITHDNKNNVLLDIKNTLEKIHGINDSKFQEIIFVSLYDKNIANNLLEMQKNMDPIKNINSILMCDIKITAGNIKQSQTINKQRQVDIYQIMP